MKDRITLRVETEVHSETGKVEAVYFYIRAGKKIPPKSHYRIVRGATSEDDGYPQIEDGVGMVRQFFDAHAKRMKQLDKSRQASQLPGPDDRAGSSAPKVSSRCVWRAGLASLFSGLVTRAPS